MQASSLQCNTQVVSSQANQHQVYRIGHDWYANGVTYAQYPGMMQALGTSPCHINDLYPFATKYRAEIALARVQHRLPATGQTVKWPVSRQFRYGTVRSTRGNYAIVATSTHHTERVRLDKLILVEKEGAQA
jgi:hypothetical protein